MSDIAISFDRVCKRFASVVANENVTFQVRKGHIHGIVGENGAGKSTAMKMLFGIYQPDSGSICVHGQILKLKSAADAIKYNIGMVHQHFMLSEPHTVIDNILLHQSQASPFLFLNRNKTIEEMNQLQKNFGFKIDLKKTIHELSVGEQQQVELLKILSLKSEIIILDEPTAVLTPQEILELFKNLRILKEAGKTILIISHKLKEIKEITDAITVFRQGQAIAHFKTADVSINQLAEAMVGRHLLKVNQRIAKVSTQPVLNFKDLSLQKDGQNLLQNINLKIHKNEIVGIAGVEGNGQNDLIQALIEPQTFANRKSLFRGKIIYYPNPVLAPAPDIDGVTVTDTESESESLTDSDVDTVTETVIDPVQGNLNSTEFKTNSNPQIKTNSNPQIKTNSKFKEIELQNLSTHEIRDLPLALMPEDRLKVGVLPDRPLTENYILGHHRWSEFLNVGFYNESIILKQTEKAISEYDIRPPDPKHIFSQMSGGNQQKLVVARELCRPVHFILAAHPTRGVDIGAIECIHSELLKAREAGAGVLLISSELDELLELADRVVVLFKGQIVAEFSRAQLEEENIALKIGAAMGGNP